MATIKKILKEQWKMLAMLLITGAGVTVTTVIYKPEIFTVIPLYNSLIIMALSARANRYSLVYGGLNSILYAVVGWKFGLLGQAASALFVSFPIQIVTFILYNRRKYGNSTLFRKLSWKWRGIVALGFAVCWVGMSVLLKLLGGSYVMLDSTITLFSFLVSGLSMFAFIEAPFLNIINSVISVVQYAQMLVDGELSRTPFLIFYVYSFICVVLGAFRTFSYYREQQALKKQQFPKTEGEKINENGLA